MIRVKLDTEDRTTSLGCWRRQRDGSYRCGNVWVRLHPKEGRSGQKNWRIFVRARGRWQLLVLRQRPWGYGHAGQAKIGAALVAAHQRGKFK